MTLVKARSIRMDGTTGIELVSNGKGGISLVFHDQKLVTRLTAEAAAQGLSLDDYLLRMAQAIIDEVKVE